MTKADVSAFLFQALLTAVHLCTIGYFPAVLAIAARGVYPRKSGNRSDGYVWLMWAVMLATFGVVVALGLWWNSLPETRPAQ